MASYICLEADNTKVVDVYYSIPTGEVLALWIGNTRFVDKEFGVCKPGWKRALAKQALRFKGLTSKAFWTDELQELLAGMRRARRKKGRKGR